MADAAKGDRSSRRFSRSRGATSREAQDAAARAREEMIEDAMEARHRRPIRNASRILAERATRRRAATIKRR